MTQLRIATLNMIGESKNPFEFYCIPDDIDDNLSIAMLHYINLDAIEIIMELDDYVDISNILHLQYLNHIVQLPLHLDNKITNRYNPIICALSPHDKHVYQLRAALSEPKSYVGDIIRFYINIMNNHKHDNDDITQLMLWDLTCFLVLYTTYQKHGDSIINIWLQNSFMVIHSSADVFDWKTFDKIERSQINYSITSIITNVANTIIACQEIPDNHMGIHKDFKVFVPQETNNTSGFIYSKWLDIADIKHLYTEQINSIFEKYGFKPDDKCRTTTIDKLIICQFYSNKDTFIVIGFHCKDFKLDTHTQAYIISDILDLFPINVYAAGDFNLSTDPSIFNEILNFNGWEHFPVNTATTCKQRSCLQAQFKKAMHITKLQKDMIIYKTHEHINITNKCVWKNEQCIIPNSLWKSDHAAVFIDFQTT